MRDTTLTKTKIYPELPKVPWGELPSPPQPWEQPIEDKGIECPLCKMVWKGVMGYCCPHAKCPVQLKATF